jgi:hypothetical protein
VPSPTDRKSDALADADADADAARSLSESLETSRPAHRPEIRIRRRRLALWISQTQHRPDNPSPTTLSLSRTVCSGAH